MKHVSQEELKKLGIDVSTRNKPSSPMSEIVSSMIDLKVGEALIMQKSEVKTTTHPVNHLRHRAKWRKGSPVFGWKFSVRTLPDRKSFAIIRVK